MTKYNRSREGDASSRSQQDKKGGSGQQTGGTQGQKLDKEDKEGFRSSEQKRQQGNRGGNR